MSNHLGNTKLFLKCHIELTSSFVVILNFNYFQVRRIKRVLQRASTESITCHSCVLYYFCDLRESDKIFNARAIKKLPKIVQSH